MPMTKKRVRMYDLPFDQRDKSIGCWWFIDDNLIVVRCPECGCRLVVRQPVSSHGYVKGNVKCFKCVTLFNAKLMRWPGDSTDEQKTNDAG